MNKPNTLSTSSSTHLATCHPILQECVTFALEWMDVGVTCGHRPKKEQNIAYNSGKSELKWPHSRHNSKVSEALDLMIYTKDFKYLAAPLERYNGCEYFYMQYARLDTLMQLKASKLGWTLRWGGKWDNPHDLLNNELIDVYHWELGEKLC